MEELLDKTEFLCKYLAVSDKTLNLVLLKSVTRHTF